MCFSSTFTSKMRASYLIFTFRSTPQGAGTRWAPAAISFPNPFVPLPRPSCGGSPRAAGAASLGPVWGSHRSLWSGQGVGVGRVPVLPLPWATAPGSCWKRAEALPGGLWWLVGAVHQQELFPAGVLVLGSPVGMSGCLLRAHLTL